MLNKVIKIITIQQLHVIFFYYCNLALSYLYIIKSHGRNGKNTIRDFTSFGHLIFILQPPFYFQPLNQITLHESSKKSVGYVVVCYMID